MKSVLVSEKISVSNEKELFSQIEKDTRGDLRAAINALQLCCVGQKTKSRAKLDISLLGSRDASLSIFHGLGKAFHPKRDPATNRFLVSPEKVSAKMPIDVSHCVCATCVLKTHVCHF